MGITHRMSHDRAACSAGAILCILYNFLNQVWLIPMQAATHAYRLKLEPALHTISACMCFFSADGGTVTALLCLQYCCCNMLKPSLYQGKPFLPTLVTDPWNVDAGNLAL